MLYRDNEILIFDEPTAVLTPQEIDELMQIMKNLAKEGKSILFISHKLAEIMAVADRCTVLRKGKYIGTVETKNTTMEELSAMMVGRSVNFHVEKSPCQPGEVVLNVEHMTVASKMHKNNAVKDVSFQVRRGEIVCIAGIDGNGQTELVYGLTGLEPISERKDPPVRAGHHEPVHPQEEPAGHEPHPRGPPQARPCAGLFARGQPGAAAVFRAGVHRQRRASCAATISASTPRA